MTKATLFISLIVACSFSSNAQVSFQKLFADTNNYPSWDKPVRHSYCVNTTSDGGYIMGVNPTQTCAGYATIIKMDANGDTLWTRTFGFSGTGTADNIYTIEQTTDGGYILGMNEGRLLKTNSSGDFEWSKEYGLETITVHQTADGGFIIGGDAISGSGFTDGCIIRTDAAGDTTWTRTYGRSLADGFYSAIETSDGGFLAVGKTRTVAIGGGTWDGYAVKTNSSGDTLWTKIYGTSSSFDYIQSVVQTNGGYVFGGGNYPGITFFKTDFDGNIIWAKLFGDTMSNPVLQSFVQTSDGGFAITGHAINPAYGSTNVLLLMTDSTGSYLWSKLYGDMWGYDYGYSIQQTPDDGFIISGAYASAGCLLPQTSAYLIKVDATGSTSCNSSTGSFPVSPLTFTIGHGADIGSGTIVNNSIPVIASTYFKDSTICFATGITGLYDNNTTATVYPNPAGQIATIQFNNALYDEYTLSLYSSEGRLIKMISNIRTGMVELEREALPNGLYFFQMLAGKGKSVTGKLVFD